MSRLLVIAAGVAWLAGAPGVLDAAQAVDSTGIAWLVRQEIARGDIPGAVILIGDREGIIYRRAFGRRALPPERERMTVDTLFDLASLTKVVATTPAILQLIEQGRIAVDAPVSRYWPVFAAHGKSAITVRELLTHTSGLQPDLNLSPAWSGRAAALRHIVALRPVAAPGTRYIYSDVNFIVLGELIERISGLPLDVYCERHLFRPLGMRHTLFRPPAALRGAIAPTEFVRGRLLRGEAQDPTAERMGGVAGHAGLFSTASDLARFAQLMLRGGAIPVGGSRAHLLSTRLIDLTTQPNRVASGRFRGLGWDLTAPFVADRSSLPAFGAFGHLGYTGTSLWIDPARDLFVVLLTSRLYPDGKGNAQPLRNGIADLLSATAPLHVSSGTSGGTRLITVSLRTGQSGSQILAPSLTGPVETGADVLVADQFAELRGLRIGLITNQTGETARGEPLIDLLARAPGVRLVALFSPEHGLQGERDEPIGNSVDAATRLPVFSLYGTVKLPTDAMLEGLDALVFDVQDSGTRFFTYVTTMAYAMQAAARHGLRFFVLDRPDPISAAIAQGPILDADLRSFTGFYPLPLRPGMTIGEIAQLFNTQAGIGARLTVVRMRGYGRGDWLDQTGLPWVRPSPNLHSLEEEILYPGVGMVEGANVSVGRGTETPFQLLGAPWISGLRLTDYLARRKIPGVRFTPVNFVPAYDRYRGEPCHGVRILLVDRDALQSGLLGIELVSALHHLYPQRFDIEATLSLVGSRSVLAAIDRGEDPRVIALSWRPSLEAFLAVRKRYLLYPRSPPAAGAWTARIGSVALPTTGRAVP